VAVWDLPGKLWTFGRKIEELFALQDETEAGLKAINARLSALEHRMTQLEAGQGQYHNRSPRRRQRGGDCNGEFHHRRHGHPGNKDRDAAGRRHETPAAVTPKGRDSPSLAKAGNIRE